jgi:hypothetical protein
VFALAFAAAGATIDLNATERAEGNRRAAAVRVGRALLRTVWPAQVLKIRIDGIANHDVAGLMISGVKFHHPLDAAGFTDEVIALVTQTFAASDVEEVDIWATVPLPPFAQKPVNGEFLQPTDRVVYGAAILRSQQATFPERLRRGHEVYWDPAWQKSLMTGARP